MTKINYIITESERAAAKYVGIAYLFTFAIVVSTNYGIYDQLIIQGSAAETANRILENKILFRLGIVADLIYAIGFTVLISSLYTILKNVNKRLAILAAALLLAYIITWVAITLKFFDALRLIGGSNYLKAVGDETLFAFSKLFLNARFDRYYGVLMFSALGSACFNYLWLQSRFIPKPLAIVGIIASTWCLICSTTFLIYPDFQNTINIWLFDTATALFDIILSIFLLTKGLKNQHS